MLHGGANPQLVNAGADALHGLPVIRLEPLLNQVELVTGNAPRILGESSQVLEGGACPEELFHGRRALYNFLYTGARVSPSTPLISAWSPLRRAGAPGEALQQLPWELLRQPGTSEALALSRRRPLVRYLAVPQPVYAACRPGTMPRCSSQSRTPVR